MEGPTVSLREVRFKVWSWMSTFPMTFAMVFALTLFTAHAIEAQTFSVLHYFTGGADGASPFAGLTVRSSGLLYGTATGGGTDGYGVVFKLSQVNSSWIFSPLYEFTGGSDGATPWGGVVNGPNGALYGTTSSGGGEDYGTVFELRPPATVCRSVLCYWNETVLHTFTGTPDGQYPEYENLVFDQAGNIYGTTLWAGMYGYGSTFELILSGGGYMESIPHSFGSGGDGESPWSGVVLDTAGNVYGTTGGGGTGGAGTVYQLMPSTGGWLENVLVNFDGANGEFPVASLIIDDSGTLYGTTSGGGSNGDGVVFKLAPSGGGFTYSVLYTFSSTCAPYDGLAMDAAGNLFGACNGGGTHHYGWIYELTNCSEICTLVDLHDFSGSDGGDPSVPVLDANGNLYGTTYDGGRGNCNGGSGCGVVWEIAGVEHDSPTVIPSHEGVRPASVRQARDASQSRVR